MLSTKSFVVLVMDNDINMLEDISQTVAQCGFEVLKAQNILQGISLLQQQERKVSIIVVDFNIALGGAIELMKFLQQSSYRDIPIIVTADVVSLDNMEQAILAGASDFNIKPLQQSQVQTLPQHVLRKKLQNQSQSQALAQSLIQQINLGSQNQQHLPQHLNTGALQLEGKGEVQQNFYRNDNTNQYTLQKEHGASGTPQIGSQRLSQSKKPKRKVDDSLESSQFNIEGIQEFIHGSKQQGVSSNKQHKIGCKQTSQDRYNPQSYVKCNDKQDIMKTQDSNIQSSIEENLAMELRKSKEYQGDNQNLQTIQFMQMLLQHQQQQQIHVQSSNPQILCNPGQKAVYQNTNALGLPKALEQQQQYHILNQQHQQMTTSAFQVHQNQQRYNNVSTQNQAWPNKSLNIPNETSRAYTDNLQELERKLTINSSNKEPIDLKQLQPKDPNMGLLPWEIQEFICQALKETQTIPPRLEYPTSAQSCDLQKQQVCKFPIDSSYNLQPYQHQRHNLSSGTGIDNNNVTNALANINNFMQQGAQQGQGSQNEKLGIDIINVLEGIQGNQQVQQCQNVGVALELLQNFLKAQSPSIQQLKEQNSAKALPKQTDVQSGVQDTIEKINLDSRNVTQDPSFMQLAPQLVLLKQQLHGKYKPKLKQENEIQKQITAFSQELGEEAKQLNMAELRSNALQKYLEKRKRRTFDKKVRYESRRKLAVQRPRIRGQFVKVGVAQRQNENYQLSGDGQIMQSNNY